MSTRSRNFVLVRGAGDIATGTIVRLCASGFLVAALEMDKPTAIRRKVALSECMYDGRAEVESVRSLRVGNILELLDKLSPGVVPVLDDPACDSLHDIAPFTLVDAILAKRNVGTRLDMAPIVVALGPGFEAGIDAHAVIETNRGHDLGRVFLQGSAESDTGIPGTIGGYGVERVVRSPVTGIVEVLRDIGELVVRDEPILAIRGASERRIVFSPLTGVIRGMIRPGSLVTSMLKIADVDPRGVAEISRSISDKARAIGGGVLEAILRFGGRP